MEPRSIEVRYVSPEEAAEYLKMNFIHQRPLRPHFVKSLADDMVAGRLIETAEIHILHLDNKTVMVNGQHTCNAIIKHGRAIRVTVRHSSVNSEEDVAFVYAYGHDNGLKRSPADALAAYDVAGQYGISTTSTNKIAPAMRHICAGFGYDKRGDTVHTPVEEIRNEFSNWVDAYLVFHHLPVSRSRERQAAYKRSVLSVALVTMRFAPEQAPEFWTGVFDPTGLKVGIDPRVAANRLLEESITVPGKAKQIDIAQMSRLVAACWNAFYRGEKLREPVVNKGQYRAPIVIAGTPYDGNQPKPLWWPEWTTGNVESVAPELEDAAIDTAIGIAASMPGQPVKRIVTMQEWLESTKRAA